MTVNDEILGILISLMQEDSEVFVPTRLAILVYLYFSRKIRFTALQRFLNLTSGNLSSHIKKLQAFDLVRVNKTFVDLKPTTVVEITQKGVERVRKYLLRMSNLITQTLDSRKIEID
ncbi:MAG: transcriptional regulator [Candidatus Hermodarchaeota archaeon]